MQFRRSFVLLAVIFISVSTAIGLDQASVSYRVKPIPRADRTDLEITVNIKDINVEQVKIRLPRDNFGFSGLERFVTSFEGIGDTRVEKGEKDEIRIVYANKSGQTDLKYTLSFDPAALNGYTFAPNVSPTHFHAAGGQWSLTVGEDEDKHQISFEMAEVPKGWSTYNSLSADPLKFRAVASFEDLVQTTIGAGTNAGEQFLIKGKPVSVFVRGNFKLRKEQIVEAVRKIVSLQRDEFQDHSQPFYSVVILPKERNVAGVRFENTFICFFKPDIAWQQMIGLLAHEMSHNWFTADIIKPDKGEIGPKYAWFYEGVNDYFARKILWKSGLLNTGQFVDLINRDVVNVADNPNRAATYDDILKATKTGKYDQAFNKLSYYRGALIGYLWDVRLRNAGTKTLTDLIREIYLEAARGGGSISPADLFRISEKYGIDARGDLERYILRGENIDISNAKLCPAYESRSARVPSFEPGFALRDSNRAKKVLGVVPDGPAYRAGLRDDMELVSLDNDNRFGNAWDPYSPLSVTVMIGAKPHIFSFTPRGTELNVVQLQRSSSAGSGDCPAL